MAKPNPERYFQIVEKINRGEIPTDEEYLYFLETTPQINQGAIDAWVAEKNRAANDPKNPVINSEIAHKGLIESMRMLQSDPAHKARLAKIVEDNKSKELTNKISSSLNLIMGGADIAQSIGQIRQSESQSKRNKRPARPAIPQRDLYLQNALRQAEVGTMDAGRALAPIQAEIQDQYQSDLANAKTASTGQAGAFGAYAQLAANRRNRAAMQMAPIQDNIRRQEQERYDRLLGMRMDETQDMFRNNAALYPYDIEQYQYAQDAASKLGSFGRENLRNSLYNTIPQAANMIGRGYSKRQYDQLRNRAIVSGMDPDNVVKVREGLDKNVGKDYTDYSDPNYWQQLYY